MEVIVTTVYLERAERIALLFKKLEKDNTLCNNALDAHKNITESLRSIESINGQHGQK